MVKNIHVKNRFFMSEILSEEEVKILTNLFKKYKKEFKNVKEFQPSVDKWVWSKGTYYNSTPLQLERSRYGVGTLLKKEPLVKKDVTGYGISKDNILYSLKYIGTHLSEKMVVVNEKDKTIYLFFSDDKMKDINDPVVLYKIIILFTNNSKSVYSLYYEISDIKTFIKEVYFYSDLLLTKISKRGYMENEGNKIKIDSDFEILYSKKNELTQIIATQKNLKSGKISKTRVYPQPQIVLQ